jgi:type IV secretory pathway VirB2 component (pilin)
MKKNIFYILIIIMLVGIFSPFFAVYGETNFQHCVTTKTNAGTAITQASQDCARTANPDAIYVDPVGTCTFSSDYTGFTNSTNTEQLTQTDCSTAGGTFSAPYVLLAPLPCDPATAGPNCVNGKLTTFDPSSASGDKISGYLNVMIRIFIGLCAVLAVVMIVIGGIEYMTSELVSSKEAGKERIRGAIFGLLLALGAWTLLNQINPDILNTNLNSLQNVTVNVNITTFTISSSGSQSRYGTSVVIDFKTQAYPAAATAQAATGVDPALVLAIFNQETANGANTGACLPAGANMTTADQTALASIVGANNVATTHVSCSLSTGHGGAIGLTQFLPSTWIAMRDSPAGKAAFGNNADQGHGANGTPDPWNTQDALMMTAVFLKAKGGATTDPVQQKAAVCAYFGSCNSSGVDYGNQVMAQAASIQKQVAVAKANGTIKP